MHVDYLYERRGGGPGFAGDWVSATQPTETYVVRLRPYEGDGLSIISPSDGVTRNVKFDGRDYPRADSEVKTVSAQRVNERTIEVTSKTRGKVVDRREISVSADGKTLTMTVRRPERSEPDVLVFERK